MNFDKKLMTLYYGVQSSRLKEENKEFNFSLLWRMRGLSSSSAKVYYADILFILQPVKHLELYLCAKVISKPNNFLAFKVYRSFKAQRYAFTE